MNNENSENTVKVSTANRRIFGRLVFFTVLITICLFGSAGTIEWLNGWVFLLSYIFVLLTLTGVVFKSSPELVEERMSAAPKAKSWDKIIVPILALVLPIIEVILAGLDKRFGWTKSITVAAMVVAFFFMIGGNLFTIWAMRVNRFFSSHVRIQSDRGHYVITNGPYRWIRHPGYTGSIIYNVAVAILLGSFPALGVGIAFSLLMAIRTTLEDATLQRELNGYREYSEKVRWKLIPFIW